MILREKGKYERRGTCGEVVYGAKCKGAKHGRDDRREE